jgi:hypothetical protein
MINYFIVKRGQSYKILIFACPLDFTLMKLELVERYYYKSVPNDQKI